MRKRFLCKGVRLESGFPSSLNTIRWLPDALNPKCKKKTEFIELSTGWMTRKFFQFLLSVIWIASSTWSCTFTNKIVVTTRKYLLCEIASSTSWGCGVYHPSQTRFSEYTKLVKLANLDLCSKKLPPVGIDLRTSYGLLWCLPDRDNLTLLVRLRLLVS